MCPLDFGDESSSCLTESVAPRSDCSNVFSQKKGREIFEAHALARVLDLIPLETED